MKRRGLLKSMDYGVAHIVYASDDKFAEILGVSLQKALETPNIIHFTTSFLSKRPWMKV